MDGDFGNKMTADVGLTCGLSGRGPEGVKSHLVL